jgi:hypothetical protein
VPTGERYVAGLTWEGRNREEVYAQRMQTVGPGGEVELPADEIARLTELGYLGDPDAIAPPLGGGPGYGA